MNRNLLIILDKTLFSFLFYFFLPVSKILNNKIKNKSLNIIGNEHFLVIRPGGLGDGIMSIPLLRSIKENFPNSKTTLLCLKKTKAVFECIPYYDNIYILDHIKDIIRFFKESILLRNDYDIVFDLEQFRKVTSLISCISGANIRIGFDTNKRRLLYTNFVTYPNEKNFESVNMVRQLEVIGVNVSKEEAENIKFTLPKSVEERGLSILKSVNINTKHDFIVAVFPGVLKLHHRWKMAEFANLIKIILHEDNKTRVLLMGTPADIPDSEEVMGYIGNNEKVVNLVGKTKFIESLGILKACEILISCDGGAVYMGASMGCKTISIWGPGVMERFKPPGDDHVGIRKNYYCIPCVNYSRLGEFPACPYNRRCINDITASEVISEYINIKNNIIY